MPFNIFSCCRNSVENQAFLSEGDRLTIEPTGNDLNNEIHFRETNAEFPHPRISGFDTPTVLKHPNKNPIGLNPVELVASESSRLPEKEVNSKKSNPKKKINLTLTLGSHKNDVLRIQGTPQEINAYPALGHEDWSYGGSSLRIDIKSGTVTQWKNEGNLAIQFLPGRRTTDSKHWTMGSHKDDVLRIQGTPQEIHAYPALGHEDWGYGASSLRIDIKSGKVTQWKNEGNLAIQFLPGRRTTDSKHWTMGSHKDDVLRIQGTPQEIHAYPALGHEDWSYGASSLRINIKSSTVTQWKNEGDLAIEFLPSSQPTSS